MKPIKTTTKWGTALSIVHWIVIILFFVMAGVTQGRSQGIQAETYVQLSAIGTQPGVALRWVNQKGWGLGGFYQSNKAFDFEGRLSNRSFSGLDFVVPIITCEKLALSGSLKAGFVNNQFLVVTPEINTQVSIARSWSLALGAGYRVGQPAVSAKVIFTHRKRKRA